MNSLVSMYRLVRLLTSPAVDVNIPLCIGKSAYFSMLSKNVFAHHNTIVRGIRNIEVDGRLFLGMQNVGFLNKHDRTYLNIQGKLIVRGDVWLGKGCRLAVNRGAVCTLSDCGITGQTNLIVAHGLEIGKGSMVAWGCELADEDFHTIQYEGKIEKDHAVAIGDHVWIGGYVKILKGVHIADNCVIAANSVVTRSVAESNVLIAGNPAQIVKRGVDWRF